MSTPNIGSDSWDASIYDESDFRTNAVRRCIALTKWDTVREMCEKLRGSTVQCEVNDKFTTGTQNLVRLIVFEDGVKWIIRMPIDTGEERWAASKTERIEIEVATYKYLRKHTTIPVPEVYAYESHENTAVGFPYVIMEYIHGTMACEFDITNDDIRRRVQEQLAAIVLELASHKFDRIGALKEDGPDRFVIGQDTEIHGGPFETAGEYYAALSKHRFNEYAGKFFQDNYDAEKVPGLHLPFMFNGLMSMFTDCDNDHGPFSLVNTDLGLHNILLDSDCNLVGLIDCDNIIAGPIHLVAQPPTLMGVSLQAPGLITRMPNVTPSPAERKARQEQYLDIFKATERKRGMDTIISDAMFSDGASLIAGLSSYMAACYEDHRYNGVDEWVRGYFYLYYRRLKGEQGCQTFSEAHIFEDEEDEDGWGDENAEDETNVNVDSGDGWACEWDDYETKANDVSEDGKIKISTNAEWEAAGWTVWDRPPPTVEIVTNGLESRDSADSSGTTSCCDADEVLSETEDTSSIFSGSTGTMNLDQKPSTVASSDDLASQRYKDEKDEESKNSERLHLRLKNLMQDLNACVGELKVEEEGVEEEGIDTSVQSLLAEMQKMGEQIEKFSKARIERST